MDIHEQEKMRALIQELAQLINAVLVQSPELQSAIREIEQKGYQVDLVLTSLTRILKNGHPNPTEMWETHVTDDDKAFLRELRIRLDHRSDA